MNYQAVRLPRRETVPVRHHHYAVRIWGEPGGGRPPLVLLHGWMDVGASFQFMVDAFPAPFLEDRLVLAPDWRGFGHTRGPACDHYVFADYLGDLDALLDHYTPGMPADLLGHSMGGNVVMMYAGVRAGRVRRVVNLEGFGVPDTLATEAPQRYTDWLDQLRALHREQAGLRDYADADAVAARLMKTNPRLPPDRAGWLAHQWAEPLADGSGRWRILGDAAHRIVSARLSPAAETLALYASIRAPVLVVEAEHNSMARWWQQRYSLPEFHRRLQSVPQVRVRTLPDCGHMLHHDQPEPLAEWVAEFLA